MKAELVMALAGEQGSRHHRNLENQVTYDRNLDKGSSFFLYLPL